MARDDEFNASAEFIAGGEQGGPYPAVKVAGVWVNVYVNTDLELVISADFDESELSDPTPVVVKMSGQVVFRA